MAKHHIGMFLVDGVLMIQRINETAPEDLTDNKALEIVIQKAAEGNEEAAAMLHLKGWHAEDVETIDQILKLHGF